MVSKFEKCLMFFMVLLFFLLVICILLFAVFKIVDVSPDSQPVIAWLHGDKMYHLKLVENINAANLNWKAKYNKFASSMDLLVKEGVVHETMENATLRLRQGDPDHPFWYMWQNLVGHDDDFTPEMMNASLPKSYDPRLQWPQCASVHEIRNQASCGSCWAIAAASVISDRICIASNGSTQMEVSVEDILTCDTYGNGCAGGHALRAFQYWVTSGVVSGGPYMSYSGCKPYTYSGECGAPCNYYYFKETEPLKCKKECIWQYDKTYEEDKNFGTLAYIIDSSSSDTVKREIYYFGPVEACADFLFEDIQHYNSGIYSPFNMKPIYGHCIKLLGWGETSDGIPYWIGANSWGKDWGENGFIRFNYNSIHYMTLLAGLAKPY